MKHALVAAAALAVILAMCAGYDDVFGPPDDMVKFLEERISPDSDQDKPDIDKDKPDIDKNKPKNVHLCSKGRTSTICAKSP